ncbi:MAG TPA: hypothetical protein VGS28_00430 [Candidatus Saccharimonadales bacterium]|nr:hypothetical protein [Candidatus Saccharimonadales bacterium]
MTVHPPTELGEANVWDYDLDPDLRAELVRSRARLLGDRARHYSIAGFTHLGLLNVHLGEEEDGNALLLEALDAARNTGQLPGYNDVVRVDAAGWVQRGIAPLAWQSLYRVVVAVDEGPQQRMHTFLLAAEAARLGGDLDCEVAHRVAAVKLLGEVPDGDRAPYSRLIAASTSHLARLEPQLAATLGDRGK